MVCKIAVSTKKVTNALETDDLTNTCFMFPIQVTDQGVIKGN